MIMDLSFMTNKKKPNAGNRNSEHNSSHSKMASDVITIKEKMIRQGKDI